jgi:hypothetical protein
MTPEFEATPVQPSPAAPASTPNQPVRSRFWPGFVAGFLLLSVVSCSGLVVATGLNRIDLAAIQGNGVTWQPPEIPTTTVTEPSADTNNDAPSGVRSDGAFALGERVRNITNSRVNIRQTPGHVGKTPEDVLGQLAPGTTLEIVAGPAPADNLLWWLIRATTAEGRPVEGWVAEVTASGVQILGR